MKHLSLAGGIALAFLASSALANQRVGTSPRMIDVPSISTTKNKATAVSANRNTNIAKGGNATASSNSTSSAYNGGNNVSVERSAPGFAVSGSSGGKGTWHAAAAVSTPAGGGGFAFGGTERFQRCIDRAEFVIRIDGKTAARSLYAECDKAYRKILNAPKKP